MNTHELAWAAGFVDGEGHFAFLRGRRRTIKEGRRTIKNIALNITQKDRAPLVRFAKAVGVGRVSGRYGNGSGRLYWRYSVTTFQGVQAATAKLWNWLGVRKRRQARKVIVGYVRTPRAKRGPLPSAYCKMGHKRTARTTYVRSNGKRQCRICANSADVQRRNRTVYPPVQTPAWATRTT
jgi:hypothetical protein